MKKRLATKIVVNLVVFVVIIFALTYGIHVSVQNKLVDELEE